MKTTTNTGLQRIVLLSSLIGLVNCGGENTPTTQRSQVNRSPSQLQASPSAPSCSQLASFTVAAPAIGLPTRGAVMASAELVAAAGSGVNALGEYCKVVGNIKPIDPTAPDIRFQINLPTVWNHKTMMFGGGGYNGELAIPFLNLIHAGPTNQPTPQGRGYAVFQSDSGHTQQPPFIFGRDGSFASNDEALRNYGSEALKKTRDVAITLLQTYYGQPAQKSYFHGGSNGGREALMVTQKWPQDYDGVIAIYPDGEMTSLWLQWGRITRAMAAPGGWLNAAKRKLVFDTGIAACDRLDGVQDGVISNVDACNHMFNGAQNGFDSGGRIMSLRCPGGQDTGDNCLSDPQIAMLKTYNTAITFGGALPGGQTQYPGFNVWGADLGMPSNDPALFLAPVLGMGSAPPSNPVGTDQPDMSVLWDQYMKYFITRDPNFNSLLVDPAHLGVWQNRVNTVSALLDATNPDLSAFRAKGGKLLVMHGSADMLVSNQGNQQYYQRVVERMGQDAVSGFFRLYQVPGYGHSISPAFNAGWDSVTALENWVEQGIAPVNQVVEDKTGVPGRTRPLCEYPSWPRYRGHGNVNLASSFRCVKREDE
jgi:feruloyl esterase